MTNVKLKATARKPRIGEERVSRNTVTVSPKYQVVIPVEIRQAMGLEPGQKMMAIATGGTCQMIPLRPMSEYRGIAKGMPTEGFREKKDRPL